MADVITILHRLDSLIETTVAPMIEKMVRKEYDLWINSKTEATKLYFNLKEIQKVLEEAERRRLADPRVKAWLENLQGVMYEVDDALDEWETLDLQLEILRSDEENASRTWLEKIGAFIESLCFGPTHVFKRRDIALKIKALNVKVDSLGEEKGKYHLLPIISDSQDVKYEITTSFNNLIEIPYQRGKKEELVNQLLPEGKVPEGTVLPEGKVLPDIQVISLVGMVGVGKTALAQLAFNDPRVQSGFKFKSWICLSHISDMVRLTKAILQSLDVHYRYDAELQQLLELIQSSLSGKKFFLVLDHVRIEDEGKWNQLKASLWRGAPGSRILVTSSNEHVGNLIGSTHTVKVQPLDEMSCLVLLGGIALLGRNENSRGKFGSIAQQIARKCEGLPLAAKTLGYYLQSRSSKQLRDDVLEKEVWQLDEVAKALFAPFAVIYNEFPLALKHCFLYFTIIPKNASIDINMLTRLWMVQGYTETELQGRDYFEQLAKNSFFHNIALDSLLQNFKTCTLHPIVHEFARYLTKTRSKIEEHRTFYSHEWPPELGSLKSVRVSLMGGGRIQEVPSEIGDWIHLRYLDFSFTPIRRLPETICNLCNLKSLDVQSCKLLSELPEKIHRLRNLSHLLVYRSGLNRLPQGLEKLTNLVELDEISVGREESKFRYLENLNQLRGSLHINIGNLNQQEDVEDVRKADLGSKVYINELFLLFRGREVSEEVRMRMLRREEMRMGTLMLEGEEARELMLEDMELSEEDVSMKVMEALQVPRNLQSLLISGYNGFKLPSWISTSLNKIIRLDIENCNECLELPPIGNLPLLQSLRISGMRSLRRVGREFLGIRSGREMFPNLWFLEFDNCDSWEEWKDITENEANALTIMPRLGLLSLKGCPRLTGLPDHLLRQLRDLRVSIHESCPRLLHYNRHPSPEASTSE